jgi:thiol-disulfide isomerase/thioredoxin
MLKTTLLSSLLAFSLLFQGCSSQDEHKKEEATQQKNINTNEITLKSTDNTDYKLIKTKNGYKLKNSNKKILILDFFATWCPPCQAEAPHLSSIKKKYSKDVAIISATIEDGISNEKLNNFKKDYHANYTIVNSPANRELIDDVANKLKLGNNFGIPLIAIYKDGKLIQYYQGAVEEEFIESDIKRALEI